MILSECVQTSQAENSALPSALPFIDNKRSDSYSLVFYYFAMLFMVLSQAQNYRR